jgi:hypothetical protein
MPALALVPMGVGAEVGGASVDGEEPTTTSFEVA